MNFRQLILKEKFQEALNILNEIADYDEKIIDYAFEDDNIKYYDFYKYALKQEDTSKLNWAISKLLSTAFCYLENAYQDAYAHLQKAILEEPDNYTYVANQLYYYGLPLDTPLINKKELINILLALKKKKPEDKDIDDFINLNLNEEEKKELDKLV